MSDKAGGGRQGAGRAARWGACAVALALTLAAGARTLTAQPATAESIAERLERLRQQGRLVVGDAVITTSPELLALYELRGYRPVWQGAAASADLERAIRDVAADGLNPAHYHLASIRALDGAGGRHAAAAEVDLLRTDALIRIRHDLVHGRVPPDPRTVASRRQAEAQGVAAALDRLIRSGRIAEGLDASRPDHPVYRRLMSELAELRAIAASGGWAPIPPGKSLRAGDSDPRVPLLRARLQVPPGGGRREAEPDPVFDATLQTAVLAFQRRHSLDEDGVVGPRTLAELNVPVQARIDQLRLNLERARWALRDLPSTFLGVNVAGATVDLVRDGQFIYRSRVIVGRPNTPTPLFQATLRHIDLNPTWTVPPGIVGEVLAQIRRDPSYLERQGMRVLDGAGRVVQIPARELARMSAGSFPYVFRQDPGPLNALGQVKFVFPNSYHVYLHDTPSKQLFERSPRTFSHGCIRVENPLALAELVLNDPAQWSRDALQALVAQGTTRTIVLPQPMPVLVLYWTVSVEPGGGVQYHPDVYSRDPALLRALGSPAARADSFPGSGPAPGMATRPVSPQEPMGDSCTL